MIDEFTVTMQPPAVLDVTMQPPAVVNVTFSQQQGLGGPPGILSDGESFETVAVSAGAQVITLPSAVSSGWCLLCINGLRQAVTAYSATGSSLTLPAALNVLAGDLISFDYYPL